jgi:hypothetical protein
MEDAFLPTDDAFLDELLRTESDGPWLASIVDSIRPMMEERIDAQIAAGYWTDEQRPEARALWEETFSLRGSRGRFIDDLRNAALVALGADAARLSAIPVAFLPSRQLNACAIRTPRGGAVVLLDSAVVPFLSLFIQSFLALYTWHTGEPFSRDHSQGAFALSIIDLCRFCVSGNPRDLLRSRKILMCRSRPEFDEELYRFALLGEIFILLHEYGHVLLGHLEEGTVNHITTKAGTEIDAYTPSQRDELAADAFTAQRLIVWHEAAGSPASDVAFSVGLVMQMFEICDALTGYEGGPSHPLAKDRWAQLKTLTGLQQQPQAAANNFDSATASVLRAWRDGRLTSASSGPA